MGITSYCRTRIIDQSLDAGRMTWGCRSFFECLHTHFCLVQQLFPRKSADLKRISYILPIWPDFDNSLHSLKVCYASCIIESLTSHESRTSFPVQHFSFGCQFWIANIASSMASRNTSSICYRKLRLASRYHGWGVQIERQNQNRDAKPLPLVVLKSIYHSLRVWHCFSTLWSLVL